MDRNTALTNIRAACNAISVELMKISPAVGSLEAKEAEGEIFKAVFAVTSGVETIKKQLAKIERTDTSRDL